MRIPPILNKSRLYSYEAFYKATEPKNISRYDYKVHKLVGDLITAQFDQLFEFDDIKLISNRVDDLTRALKVEYECETIKLSEYNYPKYIAKLEALKVYFELEKYHYKILELLRFLLFRIKSSDDQSEIEKELTKKLKSFISEYGFPKKSKPLFKDKITHKLTPELDMPPDTDVLEFVKQQVDILFEK